MTACDKVPFETHKQAMISASRQKKKSRHKYQAYRCPECGMYHITTVTKTLKQKREDRMQRKYPFKYNQHYIARKRKK